MLIILIIWGVRFTRLSGSRVSPVHPSHVLLVHVRASQLALACWLGGPADSPTGHTLSFVCLSYLQGRRRRRNTLDRSIILSLQIPPKAPLYSAPLKAN